MFTKPPRSRLHLALFGLALCVVSYTTLWDDVSIRRQLAYLDDSSASTHESQYQYLVKPSVLDGTVARRMENDGEDGEAEDSRCDNVLLYMPHTLAHEGHGDQLNAYLLAAMVATFENKPMVILEHPHSRNEFKGDSPFGCPLETWRLNEDGRKAGWDPEFPKGLSRILQHPPWLSGKCSIPCEDKIGYSDWEVIRKSRTKKASCRNRKTKTTTKVHAVGGGGLRHYLNVRYKKAMLERPSPMAYDWAMRLGADADEAAKFAELNEEQEIWDYISALMARSGLLQFQPWVARDVQKYIEQSNLPLDADYGVIHVRRGDKLKQTSTRYLVRQYWNLMSLFSSENQEGNHLRYIPFTHFLSHFDSECNVSGGLQAAAAATRLIYVATDNPVQVQREIDHLPHDDDGNTIHGCHKFQFILSHVKKRGGSSGTKFHLHSGPDDGACFTRYLRNIASIADMMIAAKSDTVVGEFNTNWGRLVRIFRMQFNDVDESNSDESLVVERDMKIAWGNHEPLPPGM
ncbi:hypothetical protein ACHAXR_013310 [Thalassiosira sp. AJA248-18]